jgi:GntR family transcriptional regulator/MocR family aminotransferase
MFGIQLDSDSKISLTRQLCEQLRIMIEKQDLKSGMRLLPTRRLAQDLKIARNIVIEAYEQLVAEGYLESRVGSGTFVAALEQKLPEKKYEYLNLQVTDIKRNSHVKGIDFSAGTPDLELFPRTLWGKYLKEAAAMMTNEGLGYNSIHGEEALIDALQHYLFRMKGIRCYQEQIFIISGSSEAFLLIAKALADIFNTIVVEEPTVSFVKDIFKQMNYQLLPIGVDQQGMKVDQLMSSNQQRLFLLTPSHQFPTGSILSIQRRHQIVELVEKTDGYIIEDDYDSEFRLKGIPIPPLQLIAPDRVFYVGTFSKILAPSLRLGFIIVPPAYVQLIAEVKESLNMRTAGIEQVALAHFINDGHLERHIYKMKKVYKKRRSFLIDCLKDYFGQAINILGDDAGLHLQVEFLAKEYSAIPWNKAAEFGLEINSLEDCCITKGKYKNKIILGYAHLTEKEIKQGVHLLVDFIESQAL